MGIFLIILGLAGIGGGAYGIHMASEISNNAFGMDINAYLRLSKEFGGPDTAMGQLKLFLTEYRTVFIVVGLILFVVGIILIKRSGRVE